LKPKALEPLHPAPAQPRDAQGQMIEHTVRNQPPKNEWRVLPGKRYESQIDREGLDVGIRRAVEILQAHGIETMQSCEGGPGHSYPEPTVDFYGGPEAGWRAVSVCLAHGLPMMSLRRVWDMLDQNELTGPYWEITFRHPFT